MTVIVEIPASVAKISRASSPFVELLRRSRFATYDPSISQTYSAPSSYAHRGNWGLKRPIAYRRKKSFITLVNFEDHAQYTEWNPAEKEVRFMKRIDEMNTLVTCASGSHWSRLRPLGNADLDSDLIPNEPEPMPHKQDPKKVDTDASGLGRGGEKAYSSMRQTSNDMMAQSQLSPNIHAMSPKEFRRYLEKLRKLRPQFLEYVNSISEDKDKEKNNLSPEFKPKPPLKPKIKSLWEISHPVHPELHRRFLVQQTSIQMNDPESKRIEQQPHINGGFKYTHPSRLESQFNYRPQPGIVVQEYIGLKNSRFSNRLTTNVGNDYKKDYLASFGGLLADLHGENALGRRPLIDLKEGVDLSKLGNSVADMRITKIQLNNLPKAVGRRPQGVDMIDIVSEVVVDTPENLRGWQNPYRPGTPEYIAADPKPTKLMSRSSSYALPSKHAMGVRHSRSETQALSSNLISTLSSMLTPDGPEKPL